MNKPASRKLYRWQLFASASLLAVGAGLGMMQTAAATACLTVGSGTLITGATSCATWTSGNVTVTNSGVLSGARTGIHATGPVGTLINDGTISGNSSGLQNATTIAALINSGTITSG